MGNASFDTLAASNELEANGFTRQQAEAVVRVTRDQSHHDLANLATKKDIADLRVDLAEVKVDLIKWLVGMMLGQVAVIIALMKLV